MENEIWKPVVGYESSHKISSKGKIVSLNRKIWNGKVMASIKERELFPCKRPSGYYVIGFNGNTCLFHRVLAMAFIPNPDNKPFINHINGNPSDNSLENLEWCTAKENTQHAYKMGRMGSGDKSSNKKITQAIANKVREKYKETNSSPTILHKNYFPSITIGTIFNIINNRTWKQ